MEGGIRAKECEGPPEAQKGKETHSPLELDFGHPQRSQNKSVLLKAPKMLQHPQEANRASYETQLQ